MKTLTKTIVISKADWERMNALDRIMLDVDFDTSMEELAKIDPEGYENRLMIEKYDAKRDDNSYAFDFDFEDGHTVSVDQYSGSSNYWTDIWFDEERLCDEVVDLAPEIKWIDEDTDTTYICRFEVEEGGNE